MAESLADIIRRMRSKQELGTSPFPNKFAELQGQLAGEPATTASSFPFLSQNQNNIPMPVEDKGKGWLDYFLNPFTKPGVGDAGGPTVFGDSDYANTMIRGQWSTDKSIEDPDAAKTMPNAVQRQDGMGLNNIAGRHGSFPLTEPPFGASGTLDTALPGMGYDYTNEGYTDFTPMGYDYTNEGYAGPWAPSYADEYAGERSPLNAVSQADWSTPQRAVSSGPTFAERDMLANAGENRDLLGIGQPVGSPPVDPREIAIKKRFGQNIGNLWGDARLRERMQDLYGGSL
jgi:hypothetical protein